MPECVGRHVFLDSRAARRLPDGSLRRRRMEVVPQYLAGPRVDAQIAGGEHPLPEEGPRLGGPEFSGEGMREGRAALTVAQVAVVAFPHAGEVFVRRPAAAASSPTCSATWPRRSEDAISRAAHRHVIGGLRRNGVSLAVWSAPWSVRSNP